MTRDLASLTPESELRTGSEFATESGLRADSSLTVAADLRTRVAEWVADEDQGVGDFLGYSPDDRIGYSESDWIGYG